MVQCNKPDFVFLIETKSQRNKINSLKKVLNYDCCFAVDSMGLSGGLAFLWKKTWSVELQCYSCRHIDLVIKCANEEPWRLTGFYGHPNRNRRSHSWTLLKSLSGNSSLPWVCLGDFNDLLSPDEKFGKTPHPEWLFRGFQEAVDSSDLYDLGKVGYPFTWFRGKNTSLRVKERLDRALATRSWSRRFPDGFVQNLEYTTSNHSPLLLCPWKRDFIKRASRFRFENVWLSEVECGEIIRKG